MNRKIKNLIFLCFLSFAFISCGGGGESADPNQEQVGQGGGRSGDTEATYRLTFTSLWNATDHVSVPGNAHFSALVLSVHNSNHRLTPLNELVGDGLERLAETGSVPTIVSEVTQDVNRGFVSRSYVREDQFIASEPSQSFEITVSAEHSMVSFASMIAPSPDWIVLVDSLNLLSSRGEFIQDSGDINLFAYDAGTEEGDFGGNYTTRNNATIPQQVLSPLSGVGFDQPFASVRLEKVR